MTTTLPPFSPAPRWAGGHKMTVYAWARPRRFPDLPPPEARFFDVAADARVLAHCHWHSDRHAHPTLLLLHGLEGSSQAHYIEGMADKAWARGFNVVRLNQRNCGGTEHLSRGLYHSGLTADPRFVLTELREHDGLRVFGVAGYSLGGNLAMKLAGELGASDLPEVRAFCAVSPVLELEACVRAIERRENRAYEWNFCRNLQGRMRRKARVFPDMFDLQGLWKIWSIRAFDERYTAPHHGFAGASDYYHRASAMRVVDRIARPALVLTAADDPFVPATIFAAPPLRDNQHVTIVVSPHGGHCAFVEPPNGYDGYYAERVVVEFLAAHLMSG
ncbi:MAG TPA: alpha/beta fold hydrolase [Vicinamibacterales bacterium]|nr:alpha/beta fold hydrolase [Vicinamibacterales bacterium]